MQNKRYPNYLIPFMIPFGIFVGLIFIALHLTKLLLTGLNTSP